MEERKQKRPDQSALFRFLSALGITDIFPQPPKQEARRIVPPDKVKVVLGENPEQLVRFYPITLHGEVEKHLKEIADQRAGFVRADMLTYLHALVIRSRTQQQLLDRFRGYVAPEHYDALAIAASIKNLRELGYPERAQVLKDGLYRKYGPDSATIEHLYSTEHIQSLFDFKRGLIEYETGGNIANAQRLYREWFAQQLKYYPHAVYVHDQLPDNIEAEIVRRAVSDNQAAVLVYSAGFRNNEMALQGCKRFIGTHPNWGVKKFSYPYGKTKGLRLELFLRSTRPGIISDNISAIDWRDDV